MSTLFKRMHDAQTIALDDERLVAAAIVRNGQLHSGGKTHADVRRLMGDEDPWMSTRGDTEGFMTSTYRFVSRRQAVPVGVSSGQLTKAWLDCGRELLSSDVNWEGVRP